MADQPRRIASVLPKGTGAVGLWVGVSGVLAYAFLAITGRALGAHEAAGLSTLWVAGFLAGNAAGFPLEQEISRAIAQRRARGLGIKPLVRRGAIATLVLAAVLITSMFLAGPLIVRELFGGDWLLLFAFAIFLVGTLGEFFVRGVAAGTGQLGAYGRALGGEAAARVMGVAVLAAFGVDTAPPFAFALAVAPFIGLAVAWIGCDRSSFRVDGPEAPWKELTRALGWLLGASLFGQALINLGPLFVRVLAPENRSLTSAFVASVIVARVPIFAFQAAQASLVPRLSHHAGGGRAAQLAAETKFLARVLVALTAVAAGGAALLGPVVVRIGWGAGFALGRGDFALLAAASCLYVLALTLAAPLVALELPNRTTLAWALGVATLALCVALGRDVLTRVEIGFLAGTAVACCAMSVLLWGPLRRAVSGASVPESSVGDL